MQATAGDRIVIRRRPAGRPGRRLADLARPVTAEIMFPHRDAVVPAAT